MPAQTAQAAPDAAETPKNPPALVLINDQPRASSLDVAAYFGKRHDNVLQQIRNTLKDSPEDWAALNFKGSEYLDSTGRALPYYLMTRDAFMLATMSLTGPKAMRFKLAWVSEFNRMEAELANRARERLTIAPDPSGVLAGVEHVLKGAGDLLAAMAGCVSSQGNARTPRQPETAPGGPRAAWKPPRRVLARKRIIDHALASDGLLTMNEGAAALRIHPRTMRQWLQEGKVKGSQIGRARSWRIPRSEIDRLLGGE